MNEWVRRSLTLTQTEDYLDQLSAIYPATRPPKRPLSDTVRREVLELHTAQNKEGLVRLLIKLTEENHPFPFEHPYASLFRQFPQLIARNPRTVNALGQALIEMSSGELIGGIERPIDINRSMGQLFRRWLNETCEVNGYILLNSEDFVSHRGKAILNGGDRSILKFVNERLGLTLRKGRDFLFKVGERYVIGEARFLSTAGGSQNRDIDEAIQFVREVKRDITAVAVFDGAVWYEDTYIKRLKALGNNEYAFSALLLYQFLDTIG